MRRAAGDLTQTFNLTLVHTNKRVEPVDGRAIAGLKAKAGRLHVAERNVASRLTLWLTDGLQQHEHLGIGGLRDNLLRAVGNLPLRREIYAESQRWMKERAPSSHTLLGIVPDDHAIDSLLQGFAIGDEV